MYTTEARPFEDLSPLTTYLVGLEQVTASPTEEEIDKLYLADGRLTDRAVLRPDIRSVGDMGYCVLDYVPSPISGTVCSLARLALHEPGSKAYRREYRRRYPHAREADIVLDHASPAARRSAARAALVTLGEYLPLSGGFEEPEIAPAYEAIRVTLENIGQADADRQFAASGLRDIRYSLFPHYREIVRGRLACTPLPKQDVLANIAAAWTVVGRPYKFPRLVSALLDSQG